MVELAEIFRRHGVAYREKYGKRMLPSHRRAMRDIECCRTEALGGHVYRCGNCEHVRYSYHSCKNRHCPKCQHADAEVWLRRQEQLRLPVPYFLLTFTFPAGLREIARSHQKSLYRLLFRASAAATQQLARDPRLMGGQIGLIGVLQTWARDLSYHPHVHYLVPGGGLAADGRSWVPSKKSFFLPVRPLGILFRAKFHDGLRKTDWYEQIPSEVWRQDWVVHCQPVGSGLAALKYLAPYVFRVALTNRRIRALREDRVAFEFRDSQDGARRTCTLPAEEFLRRFLQHVLPRGFVKVRYYGFFSSGKRKLLAAIRRLLGGYRPTTLSQDLARSVGLVLRCPSCGSEMRWVEAIPHRSRPPPRPWSFEGA